MYNDLKKIQKLLWKSDDRMDQETFFELQELVAELTLKAAQKEKKVDDLLKNFKWLYQTN
jgi:hypothetical protein